jgi:REP element-mobilizing transposase RayT
MPRRRVPLIADVAYHVYNRGNNRQALFFEPRDYAEFMRRIRHFVLGDRQDGIGTVERGPGASVIAYCLMPNHYHLLLEPTGEDLSSRMQMLSISYTKWVNARHERCGALFQGQFQAVPVREDRHLLTLTAYLHLNPVRAGIIADPCDWAFSSYREFAGTRAGTLPSTDLVLSIAGGPDAYAEFVRGFAVDAEQAIAPLLMEE